MGCVHMGCVQKPRTQPMCPHCAAYFFPFCQTPPKARLHIWNQGELHSFRRRCGQKLLKASEPQECERRAESPLHAMQIPAMGPAPHLEQALVSWFFTVSAHAKMFRHKHPMQVEAADHGRLQRGAIDISRVSSSLPLSSLYCSTN